jgi:hypothetical protein
MQKEALDILGRLFIQTIFVIAKFGVYLRRQTVSELLAKQSALQGHTGLTE